MCVLSENKATLVIADNKVENKNVSSFLGSTKVLSIGEGFNKVANKAFETFLKKNMTCNAEVVIFHES